MFRHILISLISITCAADCLDKKIDPLLEQEIRRAAGAILNPKNVAAVPPGLPEGKFETRSLRVVASVNSHALVFLMFSDKGTCGPFMSVNSYKKGSGKLEEIKVGNLGNNDSRFWSFAEKITKKCGKPTVAISYNSCCDCGAGAGLKGSFKYDNKEWFFVQDPGNALKNQEPEYEY